MARPSRNRDHTLLGHAPRDPFARADPPPGSPNGNSDVDFSDVFGGLPRRSFVYQERHGLGECVGRGGGGGGSGRGRGEVGEEAAALLRPSFCSFGEKPVFGGIGSPARRRQEGDDFFDDIFWRNKSACSTPRTTDRYLFSSNPSSRGLSPARPLPPASNVLDRGSSLPAGPAQLSFPTRPVKGSDHPAFGSPSPDVVYRNEKSISDVFSFSSPNAYATANGRRFAQTKDDPKADAYASSDESGLHCRTHHSHCRPLEATKLASNRTSDTEMQLKKDSSGLQAYSDSSCFHFSMYKWASIELTLVMPYNPKERTKSGTKASGASTQILQAADRPPGNQCMPRGYMTFHNQYDLEYKSQLSDLAAAEIHDLSLTKEVNEVFPASYDTKSIQSGIADKIDDIETGDRGDVNVSVEAWRPEFKNLSHLPNDCFDREGDKDITGQRRNRKSMVIDYTMKSKDAEGPAKFGQTAREKMLFSHTKKATKKMHETLASQKDKMIGSKVKGKVKEFIKNFNQEPASRSGGVAENQAGRPKIRNEVKGRLEARVSAHVANADEYEKEKVDDEPLSTASMAVNQKLGIGEKPDSDRFLRMQNMDNSSSEGKGISCLFSDLTLDMPDASFWNIEEAYIENGDECLVEELPKNQTEATEAGLHQEDIKISDAKIQEWSKGKEGNIRSLLSTLHYVLWPGSGWKPIPLVNIIEGASVRRAYQKALLCLHPDKLQQKGAEMLQKYIAAKVFDILQDAWTQFNSVSSL